jgi:hypothetical protein
VVTFSIMCFMTGWLVRYSARSPSPLLASILSGLNRTWQQAMGSNKRLHIVTSLMTGHTGHHGWSLYVLSPSALKPLHGGCLKGPSDAFSSVLIMRGFAQIHWIHKQVRVQWLVNTELSGSHENTASIESEITWGYGDFLDTLYSSLPSVRRGILMSASWRK